MLIYDEKKNKIQIGNEVEAEGKLSFLKLARNPGNFDQKAYYQRQNIHGKVWSETLKINRSHSKTDTKCIGEYTSAL